MLFIFFAAPCEIIKKLRKEEKLTLDQKHCRKKLLASCYYTKTKSNNCEKNRKDTKLMMIKEKKVWRKKRLIVL